MPSRRDALRGLASLSLALPFAGCAPAKSGGANASLWYSCGDKARKVLLGLVGEFNAAHDDLHIEAVYQGDYFEALAKLRTAISAGAAPTVSHVVAEVLPYLEEAGVLEPLDSLRGKEDLELIPALTQAGTFSGASGKPLVALPFNRSTPIAYYNKRLFKEAGLAVPTTWEELRAVAKALTIRQSDTTSRYGFECPVDWWFWAALVGQAGGELVSLSGDPTLGGDAGVRALELWQTMVNVDRSMKPPPGRDYNAWEATNTDFMAGRVAMIWTSTAFLRYLEENSPFEVGAAPLPSGVRAAVPTGGTFFVMPRGARDRAKATGWEFLRFMMQPAQANAWATRTGYMPVSQAGLAELTRAGYYASHPNDGVAIAQLANVAPWPWSPDLFRIQREAVQPRLEEAVLSGRDARVALDEARRVALDP